MDITLTIKSPQFKDINATEYASLVDSCSYIYHGVRIPINIQINRTYYKVLKGKLTAFRILAYALTKCKIGKDSINIDALVQYPNSQPIWESEFITPYSKFYLSKEIYIESAGNSYIKLQWETVGSLFPQYAYAAVIGFKEYVFEKRYGVISLTDKYRITHFIKTQDGFFANLEGFDGRNLYLSREECISKDLNNLQVEEFADDDFPTFNITIKPNTPRYSTIKIITE